MRSTRRWKYALPVMVSLVMAGTMPLMARAMPIDFVQPAGSTQPPSPAASWLRRRFGVDAVRPMLAQGNPDSQRLAVERLAALGDPQSIDLLVSFAREHLEGDSQLSLTLVRALADKLGRDEPRAIMVGLFTRSLLDASHPPAHAELLPLVQRTAAVALACSHEAAAVQTLIREALGEGATAQVARHALTLCPPDARSILSKLGASEDAVGLLSSWGDLRGVQALRGWLGSPDSAVQAASERALASMGDGFSSAVARGWLHSSDPKAQRLAVEVLSSSAPDEALPTLKTLLEAPATRGESLALVPRLPRPELAPALLAWFPAATFDEQTRLLSALGACGGADAASFLGKELAHPELAPNAALALALSPSKDARRTLELALRDSATRAVALRAAAIRDVTLGDPCEGFKSAAHQALSGSSEERSAAWWALTTSLQAIPTDVDIEQDPVAAASVAAAAFGLDRALLAGLSPALTRVEEARLRAVKALSTFDAPVSWASRRAEVLRLTQVRDALSLALLAAPKEGPSSDRLRAWVEEGGALSPLALRALAARDEETWRPFVQRAIAWGGRPYQLAALDGLALSSEPSATGRLVTAYRFEGDDQVRWSIIHALGQRQEAQRKPTLVLAASLDPDERVRAMATQALHGSSPSIRSDRATWVRVATAPRKESNTPVQEVLWLTPDGLPLPLIPSPEGAVVLTGLGPGESQVTLAPNVNPFHDPLIAPPSASSWSTALPQSTAASASSGIPPSPPLAPAVSSSRR